MQAQIEYFREIGIIHSQGSSNVVNKVHCNLSHLIRKFTVCFLHFPFSLFHLFLCCFQYLSELPFKNNGLFSKSKTGLFNLETSTQVLWKTVKAQMKCHLRQHFIRVLTATIKIIFRDRNISLYRYVDQQPLKIQNSRGQNIPILHLPCKMSDLQFSLVLQTHAPTL